MNNTNILDEKLLAHSLGWRLSKHARSTLMARGFTKRDVLLACVAPEVTYTAYDYGEGRAVHQRGHVAAVVHEPTRTVITVLLRRTDQWDDQDARVANTERPTAC